MAINNLKNKVSKDDMDKVDIMNNKPEYEQGFEPLDSEESGGIIFDNLFGDDGDESFGKDTGIGSSGGAFGGNIQTTGGTDLFNGVNLQGNTVANNNTNQLNTQVVRQRKPDRFDKAAGAIADEAMDTAKHGWGLAKEMAESIRHKNKDDIAYFSGVIIKSGAIIGGLSFVIGLLGGHIFGISALKVFGNGMTITLNFIVSSLLMVGTGFIGISVSAFIIMRKPDVGNSKEQGNLDNNVSKNNIDSSSFFNDTSSRISDGIDFSSLDEDDEEEDGLEDFTIDDLETFDIDEALKSVTSSHDDIEIMDGGTLGTYVESKVDFEQSINNVAENTGYINREILFNTFKGFFPLSTPHFSKVTELAEYSDDFRTINTICLKALANVKKCEIEEIKSKVESVRESFFSYEIRLKRERGITKLDDIRNEMEAYFREGSEDYSVSASVDMEGDFYKIVVTKGVKALITIGDVLQDKQACDYFLNKKTRLPLIAGITEFGKPVLVDAKNFDTTLIAGKQRSGKSWYLLQMIVSLMAFNTPEEVQFIIVDPKESNLFKNVALMPHVCGLHNGDNILEIMKDIIERESPRRKKILADNRCDTIWELWDKGIKIPVLYLVIDEVMTITGRLGTLASEFSSLMMVIMSQLPSQGIRIIMVPHRAQGVIDKTNRTLISYAAVVRGENEVIKETLGVTKWTRTLVNEGDIALKMNGEGKELFVKGPGLTTSDSENNDLILSLAKAYYKMGVDIPDIRSLGATYNRNDDYIRKELENLGTNHVQYNADNIFNDLD